MRIVLLNGSKVAKSNEILAMASALELQFARHYSPAWGVAPIGVSVASDRFHVPVGSHVISILDDPDDPDALGYHTEENAVYYARVFTKPVLQSGGVMLYDARNPNNTTVSSVVSHEGLEMAGNPNVNRWVDGPAITAGSEYSFENSDPVESDSYSIMIGTQHVAVSNFVFPEWFDPQTRRGTRVDYLSQLHAPFTMTPGGYMIVRKGPGHETAIYGDEYPAWRKASKSHATRFAKLVRTV